MSNFRRRILMAVANAIYSCFSGGFWADEKPWNDFTPWKD